MRLSFGRAQAVNKGEIGGRIKRLRMGEGGDVCHVKGLTYGRLGRKPSSLWVRG